jgi:RNA polymerase sigma-70 factor (ECF subfamily)
VGLSRVILRNGRHSTLARRVARGESDAGRELVALHWSDAYRVAYLLTGDAGAAEEVTQDGLLAAVRAIESFDCQRPLAPWLHRIVANKARDWLRQRGRRPELVIDGDEQSPAVDPRAEEEMMAIADQALSEDLTAALVALSEDLRVAVVLRFLLGYDTGEIARLVNAPSGTVRTRIHRGLRRLRVALEQSEGGPVRERAG